MTTLDQPDAQKSPLSNTFQHPSATICNAYGLCRRAEQGILTELESSSHTSVTRAPLEAQLVHVRLLGHLMDEGPGDAAAAHIAASVVGTKDDEELYNIGKFYLEHFIRTFRKVERQTPEHSQSESQTSFDEERCAVGEEPVSAPMNHQQATQSVRFSFCIPNVGQLQRASQALARDSFRCVISGSVDYGAAKKHKELGEEPMDLSGGICATNCCHIMSESTNANLGDPKKRAYAANAWTILRNFGYTDIHLELAGTKVHSLGNILTMDAFLHARFDDLDLWLEATSVPHRYKVCTSDPDLVSTYKTLPRFVTFSSAFPELNLPSPKYLGLHAACCRVAHMSGAAGYLDMLDDMDDNFNPGTSNEKFAGDLMAKLYSIQVTENDGALYLYSN